MGKKTGRRAFDRSHGLKTTFDAGYLVPILVDEALPGDTFNLNMTGFARFATPIKPIMDNMFMDTFFFFPSEPLNKLTIETTLSLEKEVGEHLAAADLWTCRR